MFLIKFKMKERSTKTTNKQKPDLFLMTSVKELHLTKNQQISNKTMLDYMKPEPKYIFPH